MLYTVAKAIFPNHHLSSWGPVRNSSVIPHCFWITIGSLKFYAFSGLVPAYLSSFYFAPFKLQPYWIGLCGSLLHCILCCLNVPYTLLYQVLFLGAPLHPSLCLRSWLIHNLHVLTLLYRLVCVYTFHLSIWCKLLEVKDLSTFQSPAWSKTWTWCEISMEWTSE